MRNAIKTLDYWLLKISGLNKEIFPVTYPFSKEAILDPEYLPEDENE